MNNLFVTYSNWSKSSTNASSWLGATLSAAIIDRQDVELYLVRAGKLSTLSITLDRTAQLALLELLKENLTDDES